MAKHPRPWYRRSRGVWYVQLHGKQYNLGPNREEAFRKFHQIMASPEPAVVQSDSLAVILDKFLEWTKNNRAYGTYDWYQKRLQEFLSFGSGAAAISKLDATDLKPFHVQEWIDSKNCSGGHKRGCITAIKRAMNWAYKIGHIESNPIAMLERPEGGRREFVISRTLYEDIRKRATDQHFHDLVTLAWETGARPEELFALDTQFALASDDRWIYPKDKSKGKRRQRVVYLSDLAADITQRLLLANAQGKLLRNSKGNPWKPNNVRCRFKRLKPHIGTQLCLYNFRHSFATRMIEAGVDSLVVATLMGHSDLSMLGRTYAHLTQNSENLRHHLRAASNVEDRSPESACA